MNDNELYDILEDLTPEEADALVRNLPLDGEPISSDATQRIVARNVNKSSAVLPKRRRYRRRRICAVAAVLAVIIGTIAIAASFAGSNGTTPRTYFPADGATAVIAARAVYPPPLDYIERNELPSLGGSLDSFYSATVSGFFDDLNGKNRVYSPVNLWFSAAILAECCEGEAREQLLELLGVESVEELRNIADTLWKSLNSAEDDGDAGTPPTASSLWLRSDLDFSPDTLSLLANDYYASSYRGNMASGEFTQMLRDWVNTNTNELLKDYADNLEFRPDTAFAIFSTIYYSASWFDEFDAELTAPSVFHGANGDETVDFMNEERYGLFYTGEGFTAGRKMLTHGDMGGNMWFILPDKGVSVDEVITNRAVPFLLDPNGKANVRDVQITLSVPKFDVKSELDLVDRLKKLGVTECFDNPYSSSALTNVPCTLDEAKQNARVVIDEENVTASAVSSFVHLEGLITAFNKAELILDRPFIFAITGARGEMLFIGVVNEV